MPTLKTLCLGIVALAGSLAGYRFTLWILAAVAAAMIFPSWFLQWGPWDAGLLTIPRLDLQNRWLMLLIVQLVMFSMGTQMGLRDFAGVVKMPYPVLVGIGLQFTVMPLTGYTLARLFGFPPEIAAGVVLIGSCSSGLASNVMCYLSGANLALSITLTALATLLAPLATPFWMHHLAGTLVEVDPFGMMGQIAKLVLIPIGAAMLHDYLKHASRFARRNVGRAAAVIAVMLTLVGIDLIGRTGISASALSPVVLEALMLMGGAVVVAVAYHHLAARYAWIDRQMPVAAMFGIVYFTLVTTAAGRDNLLVVGLSLVLAAVLHNLIGYGLGYSVSRLVGLDKNSATTVAFEVGMQNGGMAAGIASYMGKLGTVGLAAAIFSPWMNVSGSILANQIRKRRHSPAPPQRNTSLDQALTQESDHATQPTP
jgi:BASS family bile acid:Na+ symporter